MTSVHVCYNNTKKVIKIAPNDTVYTILTQAVELFRISADHLPKLVLKYKKTTLENSLLFRYTSVPSNSVLDLVLSESLAAAATSSSAQQVNQVKIALSVQTPSLLRSNSSTTSTIISFSAESTIADVLERFVNENVIIPMSSVYESAEIVIMHLRRSIACDDFSSTSLASLGFANGQSIRLQLRLKESPGSMKEDSAPPALDSAITAAAAAAAASISMDAGEISSTSAVEAEKSAAELVISLKEALSTMLSKNFDARSIPAILTITKYLANILSHPTESKYRTIKLSNKAYQEKIAAVDGASQILYSIGFRANLNTGDESTISLIEDRNLSSMFDILQEALEELNVPEADRPRIIKPMPILPASANTASFDIFKSSITRTAPQVIYLILSMA
jgi:hypothetical protein